MIIFLLVAATMCIAAICLTVRPHLRLKPGAHNDVKYGALADGQAITSKDGMAGKQPLHTLIVIALVIPTIALAIFFSVSSLDSILSPALTLTPPGMGHAATAAGTDATAGAVPVRQALSLAQVDQLTGTLLSQMQRDPDNAKGWTMLARAYYLVGKYAEAAAAYGKASSLLPGDAELLVSQADALIMSDNKSLQSGTYQLLNTAVQIDPDNVRAQALAASVAFEQRIYGAAIKHWGNLLKKLPPRSQYSNQLRVNINQARRLLESDTRTKSR